MGIDWSNHSSRYEIHSLTLTGLFLADLHYICGSNMTFFLVSALFSLIRYTLWFNTENVMDCLKSKLFSIL